MTGILLKINSIINIKMKINSIINIKVYLCTLLCLRSQNYPYLSIICCRAGVIQIHTVNMIISFFCHYREKCTRIISSSQRLQLAVQRFMILLCLQRLSDGRFEWFVGSFVNIFERGSMQMFIQFAYDCKF